jgi:hypothetical protein
MRRLTVLGLVALAALLGSCGGGGGGDSIVSFTKAGPPPPKRCLELWNSDQSAKDFGKHAYSQGHDSRAARVTNFNDPDIGVVRQCMVVFAAKDTDREYGTLGEFSSPGGGWQLITYLALPSQQQRIDLQDSGSEANAELREDGTLVAFEF